QDRLDRRRTELLLHEGACGLVHTAFELRHALLRVHEDVTQLFQSSGSQQGSDAYTWARVVVIKRSRDARSCRVITDGHARDRQPKRSAQQRT
ncbi:MAG TPA: hypothetical protein VFZ61_26415, partial [Polyangiales bacterium]